MHYLRSLISKVYSNQSSQLVSGSGEPPDRQASPVRGRYHNAALVRQGITSMRSQELGHAQKYNKPFKIMAGVTIALGAFGLAGCSSQGSAGAESPSPSASSSESSPSPSASATEQPKSHEEQVKELEIPAGLSAEDYAKQFVSRWSDWNGTTGATPELQQQLLKSHAILKSDWSTVEKIADDNKQLYTDALYIPDWQQNPRLVNSAEYNRNNNVAGMETWLVNHGAYMTPDYKDTYTVQNTELVSQNGASRVIRVTIIEHTNNEKMSIPNKGSVTDGAIFDRTWTTQTIDGTERISNWQ